MNAYQACDAANGNCICKSGWSGTTCSDGKSHIESLHFTGTGTAYPSGAPEFTHDF